jgi:hypothetical protein
VESSEQPRVARRSVGEWLFQLATITIGVLIALSFDSLLKWNADRMLVNEARANIAREIDDNRRKLEGHLSTHEARIARLDTVLKLLDAQDAGVHLTTGEMGVAIELPLLNDAGWRTAEQTGALGLMDYDDVQRLAELYAAQTLRAENLSSLFLVGNEANSIIETASDPFALPVPTRETLRARVIEARGFVMLDDQFGGQLLAEYEAYLGAAAH